METIINNGTPLESLLNEQTIARLNLKFFKSEECNLQTFTKHRTLTQKKLKKKRNYLFYTNCTIPQTLKEFKVYKVNVEGLSKREAAKRRAVTYSLWKQWQTNYIQLHDLIREESCKETSDKVRRRRSYMANKLRQ